MHALVETPLHLDITLAQTRTTETMERHCVLCLGETVFTVDRDRFEAWRGGTLIQNVWPELSAPTREMMISGTHPACWDSVFGDED